MCKISTIKPVQPWWNEVYIYFLWKTNPRATTSSLTARETLSCRASYFVVKCECFTPDCNVSASPFWFGSPIGPLNSVYAFTPTASELAKFSISQKVQTIWKIGLRFFRSDQERQQFERDHLQSTVHKLASASYFSLKPIWSSAPFQLREADWPSQTLIRKKNVDNHVQAQLKAFCADRTLFTRELLVL